MSRRRHGGTAAAIVWIHGVELVPFDGAGHGLFGSGYRDEIVLRTARFLYEVLGLARAYLTKDECEHGGWRRYDFRNQGQCVAFVERGPKP